jgi:CRISP-associated protein Cas1
MNAAAPINTLDALMEAQPPLPVRRLHNYFYCARLLYFQWVENLFEENADTIAGRHAHRNVDKPSSFEEEKRAALAEGLPEGARLRSLKLESAVLGLVGVVDLLEGGPDGAEVVDYKKGSARRGANGERMAKEADAVQVAAHALMLAEAGTPVGGAWIYYAEDKRRVRVELTEELYEMTRRGIVEAKALGADRHCPPPLVNDPRCQYCSAYPICLPNESRWWAAGYEEKVEEAQMAFVFDGLADRSADPHARSTKSSPEIKAAPRPDGDAGEILVVQKPGAQVGQRGDLFTVSVKGEVVQKMPGHQLRAIYSESQNRFPKLGEKSTVQMSRIGHESSH